MRVKICGITNIEDAMAALEFGADAVGFVFVPESPRFVPPATVRTIISALPPFITTVGVFGSGEGKDFRRAIEECGVDLIQFHGLFPLETMAPFAARAIRVLRVRDEEGLSGEILAEGSGLPFRAWLFDSHHPRMLGGTGVPFDWNIAARATRLRRLILSGGLTPDNVGEAIDRVRPYGVDVSSGVEEKKGKKDLKKLKRFIEIAKAASDRIEGGNDESPR